jgi:hypothetical protein
MSQLSTHLFVSNTSDIAVSTYLELDVGLHGGLLIKSVSHHFSLNTAQINK